MMKEKGRVNFVKNILGIIIWLLCLFFISCHFKEISFNSHKKILTDVFRACANQSIQEEGGLQFQKPETGHSFLFLSCRGAVAKEFHDLVKLYKIYDKVQKMPKEIGGGLVETIYFGQVITSHLSDGQVHRTKTDPGSNCHKTYKISDGKIIDEYYGCLLQIDLSSQLVRDLRSPVDSSQKSLTDVFRACTNQSIQEEGGLQFQKPETGHSFLFLSCRGAVAKEFHDLVKLYKIYDKVQKMPKEIGGGLVETIYFGQVITSHLSDGQVHRTKADPGSNCHKTYKISDGKIIDEYYGCLLQIDLFSQLVKDLDL